MKKLLYTLLLVASLTPMLAMAQADGPNAAYGSGPNAAYNNVNCQNSNTPYVTGNGTFHLCNPLGAQNFCDLVKALLNIVMTIGVPIAVLFLVWSGFMFIFARGSEEGLRKAKKNFQYVIIGIAVFLGAWTLASIIAATLQSLGSNNSINICTNR